MTLIKPIAYWQKKKVVAVSSTIPQPGSIIFRFENPLVNASTVTNLWTDTSGLGYTTGRIEGTPAPTINATANSLRLDNSGATRTARFRVTTNTNVTIKTMCIIFNMPYAQYTGTSTTARDYFWDMRSAGTTSAGGYLNQIDSIDGSTTAIYYNGQYWSYNDSGAVRNGPLAITPANITNGANNTYGGTQSYQWLGPNGSRAIYTPKRLWMFNFDNASKPFNFTSTATKGLIFGTNDAYTEGGSLGIYAIIGWNTLLTDTDFTQLTNYFKATGVLTP